MFWTVCTSPHKADCWVCAFVSRLTPVKLAVPCLTLVVEIRGPSHEQKSWLDDGEGARRKPWDGDIGSIQEFIWGIGTAKAGSYKEAFKMCARKQVEEALSKAQLAVNEHDRRRTKLSAAFGTIKMEYSLLVHTSSKLKEQRQNCERQEILNKVYTFPPLALTFLALLPAHLLLILALLPVHSHCTPIFYRQKLESPMRGHQHR